MYGHDVPVFNIAVEALNYDLYPELYDGFAHVIAQELCGLTWSTLISNNIVINGNKIELGFAGKNDYWFQIGNTKYVYMCVDFYDLAYAVLMHYCEQVGGTPLYFCEQVGGA